MSVSLYDISIPTYRRALQNLASFLDKAEAHAKANGGDLAAFTEAAPTIAMKLNTEHAEEVRLMAQQLRGDMAPGAWRVVGLDPHGIDLKSEHHSIRVDFDVAGVSAAGLAAHVAKLVAQARERSDQ